MKKKILYVDMDNVLVDFKSAIARLDEQTKLTYAGRLDEVPGIFSKMRPMKGAIAAFRELNCHFDTYVLSTSPWNNPSAWSDKLKWVKKYLEDEAHKRLIITHHKNLNMGDYLVDDRTNNGADKFKGELILFGSRDFPGWPKVTEYLLKNK